MSVRCYIGPHHIIISPSSSLKDVNKLLCKMVVARTTTRNKQKKSGMKCDLAYIVDVRVVWQSIHLKLEWVNKPGDSLNRFEWVSADRVVRYAQSEDIDENNSQRQHQEAIKQTIHETAWPRGTTNK